MGKLYTGLATAPQHVRLEAFHGVDVEMQRRVGTLVLLGAMLERQVEITLWLLTDETLDQDAPPSTDKLPIGARAKKLRTAVECIADAELRSMMVLAMDTLDDLLVVRHTVVHGVPWGQSEGRARLVRNASMLGEARSRAATTLVLDDGALDQSADAADIILRALVQAPGALIGAVPREFALELAASVRSSRERMAAIREAVEAEKPPAVDPA